MKTHTKRCIAALGMAAMFMLLVTPAGADGACCKKGADQAVASTPLAADTQVAAQAGRGGGKHGGGKGAKRGVMQNAHTLVFNNGSLTRTIEDLPNGVRTRNTTTDPRLVAVLQKHPQEMNELYKNGGQVRKWDPLFAELATAANQIHMEFTMLDNGIEVLSTSDNAEVVKLIQAHARKVSEFVARGAEAMREPTAIPEGYKRADGSTASSEPTGACCGMCKKDEAAAAAALEAPAADHQH